MVEPNPLLVMLLDNASFVGPATIVEEHVRPLDVQLNLKPGDAGVMASSNSPLESDFTVVRLVEPSKYAKIWPDWEERVELNDHVLCEIFSPNDPVIHLGWVHLLKIVPITEYRYRQCRRWIKDGFPDATPPWVVKLFQDYTDALSQYAPERIPRRAVCKHCASRDVVLVVTRKIAFAALAGCLVINGDRRYLPVSELEEKSTHKAQLHCQDCDRYVDLVDDDWILPGMTD